MKIVPTQLKGEAWTQFTLELELGYVIIQKRGSEYRNQHHIETLQEFTKMLLGVSVSTLPELLKYLKNDFRDSTKSQSFSKAEISSKRIPKQPVNLESVADVCKTLRCELLLDIPYTVDGERKPIKVDSYTPVISDEVHEYTATNADGKLINIERVFLYKLLATNINIEVVQATNV